MLPVQQIGSHRAYVRCYRVGQARNAKHFNSTARFDCFQQITAAAAQLSNPGPFAEKALIFIRNDHLPDELRSKLGEHIDYFEFAAFTSALYALQSNGSRIPNKLADPDCTNIPCDGFAVTMPVQAVNIKNSMSFSEIELRPFLGKLHSYAGEIVVVNVSDRTGYISLPTAANTIIRYSQYLLSK